MRHVPDERVQNRVGEQMMGVPVRHIKEDGLLLVPSGACSQSSGVHGDSVHCEVASSS